MNTTAYDPIAVFREIAQSAYPQARVLPRSHKDKFGYRIDARQLVQQWDGLAARAEDAEAENAKLRETINALTRAIAGP